MVALVTLAGCSLGTQATDDGASTTEEETAESAVAGVSSSTNGDLAYLSDETSSTQSAPSAPVILAQATGGGGTTVAPQFSGDVSYDIAKTYYDGEAPDGPSEVQDASQATFFVLEGTVSFDVQTARRDIKTPDGEPISLKWEVGITRDANEQIVSYTIRGADSVQKLDAASSTSRGVTGTAERRTGVTVNYETDVDLTYDDVVLDADDLASADTDVVVPRSGSVEWSGSYSSTREGFAGTTERNYSGSVTITFQEGDDGGDPTATVTFENGTEVTVNLEEGTAES
jgi:hypothetical protein